MKIKNGFDIGGLHASMYQISKLIKKDLVRGIPKFNFYKDILCYACQKGKQTRTSFKPKDIVSTSKPLELLHLDLFGPIKTQCNTLQTYTPCSSHGVISRGCYGCYKNTLKWENIIYGP